MNSKTKSKSKSKSNKLITTSAQKTVSISQKNIIRKLKNEIENIENIKFNVTRSNKSIMTSSLKDGSEITIASFEKKNGKNLAMIDIKGILESQRNEKQSFWRQILDQLFK